ncbi:hypothetical protein A7982_12844 [Minicystis rosea]|nr:hypothetical protein A7982_12844 [Minicystis rosea]
MRLARGSTTCVRKRRLGHGAKDVPEKHSAQMLALPKKK